MGTRPSSTPPLDLTPSTPHDPDPWSLILLHGPQPIFRVGGRWTRSSLLLGGKELGESDRSDGGVAECQPPPLPTGWVRGQRLSRLSPASSLHGHTAQEGVTPARSTPHLASEVAPGANSMLKTSTSVTYDGWIDGAVLLGCTGQRLWIFVIKWASEDFS